ncbi:MAG: type I secretion system permease/ATPase [Burkholderiales bacterium]|nr:type I secretion system permease/ATPase [Burkholderiales bacterium]
MTDISAAPTAPARELQPFAGDFREASPHPDPLLDCLVELTRIHGRPQSRSALAAGLPLGAMGLTPSVFPRAAARAGLAARFVRRTLDAIDPALLPVVLLLEGDTACLLVAWDDASGEAVLLFPDAGQGEVRLPRDALAARYAGIAIVCRPKFRFDRRTPEVTPQVARHWFWGAMLEQLPLYKDMIGAALLINLFAIALPMFTMNVYDRVVPNFAQATLWMLALGLVLVLGADYLLRVLRGHFVDMAGTRIDVRLSAQIMERVLGMKLAQRPESVGAYANSLRSFESIRDFIASATVTGIVDVPFAILFLATLAWISWPLMLVPLAAMVVVLGYSFVMQGRMHALAETTYRAAGMRNATLVEALTALETIKAIGAERVVQTRLEETASFLARTSAQLRLASSKVVTSVTTLQQLVSLGTVITGVYLIHAGWLTTGGLVAATMLAGRAMGPLGQMVGLMMQYQNARTALESLEATMTAEPERPAERNWLHRPVLQGEIAFNDVHFAYPNRDQEALRGVSFRIRPGEKVVVIGRVGSGKTTLQRLVLGLYAPTSGTITVDGADVRQVDPADLRRNIGYVEQSPTLFYGTLRENIVVAAPHVDENAILAAAHVGGLLPLANKNPRGFDMAIGERGESLSGGQRQGVAIARAVLLDPPILLLDEPTGAMDFSSEAEFKQRLRKYAASKTMLIVSHRTSLLELADRIIVLDEGQVVADGPKDKVMADLEAGRVRKAA